MSKYFAKYLPVEEEGGIEDLYIFKVDGRWGEPCYFDDLLGGGIQEVKLVKLFLCNRDIQVGDTIQFSVDTKPTIAVENENQAPKNEGFVMLDFAIQEGAFKVVGEISHEATWIKEGDEFEEEDVEAFYYDTRFGTQVGPVEKLGKMTRFVEIKYLIKGKL